MHTHVPFFEFTAMLFTMQAIVADKYHDDAISTVKVLVLQINDNNNKSRLTEIINFLNEKFPMNKLSLGHLKRIDSKRKACRIVICPVHESSKNDDQDDHHIIIQTFNQLEKEMQEFLNDFGLENLKIFQVPMSAPLTRNQFQRTSMLWPVNFHENKRIAGCLSGSVFSKDQLERIHKLMSETLSLVENNNNNNDNGGKKKCSTIITKNDGKHIVTKAVSRMHHEHPLHHAIIIAISNVADIHSKYKSSNVDLEPDLIEQYKDDYLCTNYECFISQEPCMMCAMALVHSRIKRVFFYSANNDDDGGQRCEDCNDQSFTVHNLHLNSDLNHRYEAWKLSPTMNSLDKHIFPNKKLKTLDQ